MPNVGSRYSKIGFENKTAEVGHLGSISHSGQEESVSMNAGLRWRGVGEALTLFYGKHVFAILKSKKISNDQEPIQSDPTSCPQNQREMTKYIN